MAVGFLIVWIEIGSALLNQTDITKLEWVLCKKEAEESLVGCLFIPFLTIWQERNKRAFDNMEIWEQLLKSSFMVISWKALC